VTEAVNHNLAERQFYRLGHNLAPELERAIRNGRQVHELMVEAGRRYALALKKERRSRQG